MELDGRAEAPVAFGDELVPEPRVAVPGALGEFVGQDARERALRAWGSSYQDVIRALRGDFRFAPDAVATPRDEREIEQVLEWAAGANLAVIPFGGGTSVVGGVRPELPAGYDGVVTLDMTALDRLVSPEQMGTLFKVIAYRGPGWPVGAGFGGAS